MQGNSGATDVFVVGGGPAGLATAIAARRKGFSVTLAEARRPPIDKACGEGLLPKGIEALERLGVHQPFDAGFPIRGIRFAGDGFRATADFPSARGWGIRRTLLHEMLAERAAAEGVRLLWGASVNGIGPGGVSADGRPIRARWVIGADGAGSQVRRWAGLEHFRFTRRRFGFRQHYRAAAWTEHVEVHWGARCQLYVTRIGHDEFGIAVLSRDPHLRVEAALPRFPEIASRLRGAEPLTSERGGISASYRLKRVAGGCVALVGDASGGVDAISGDGLSLCFQQAIALASAIENNDLARYEAAHRKIARGPQRMTSLMLALGRNRRLQHRALRALAARPQVFSMLLARHVGEPYSEGIFPSDLLWLFSGMLWNARRPVS